ncbi:lipopolysaccharide transport periplasmic protein LptA [Halomonas sp. IOP_31]|uniref:lipopolysaccharide transport periplasmic protein LptA n=1 Tax=Halomonas sp. IOP_31 TaxID=2876584 RepID=UPI001E3C04B8|nr:lipopolysaccharide transport periplasmic protein LptA [Halomonas sp. IOP_31]MCD6008321.1 lipopolysaccharide transport periplasmic protein LptA [Halomonas sp. IOP_31]
MMRTLFAALTLAGAALLAAPALALDSDADQPINIAADRLDLDDRAGTAVYTGDVDMQQGSMQLTAQRVEIKRNDQGEVTQVTAIGDAERAYLEQRPAPDDPLVKGWGDTIIYYAGERRVELVGQAELRQTRDTFSGAYVEYFLDNRQVQARSQAQGAENERVRMSLTPKSAEQ